MAENTQKKWTPEQDDLLYQWGGVRSTKRIAKELKRTETAIIRRMDRLGIRHKHAQSGTYSAHELAGMLGVDTSSVIRWIQVKGLYAQQCSYLKEASQTHKNEVLSEQHKPYFIAPSDFWRWAKQNKDAINWHLVPVNAIPPEPDWVGEQRVIDYHRGAKRKTLWTKEQDESLWRLYYIEGMKQKDIAKLMGRTLNGVERRLARLRKQRLK